jgi:hypothetical protein
MRKIIKRIDKLRDWPEIILQNNSTVVSVVTGFGLK